MPFRLRRLAAEAIIAASGAACLLGAALATPAWFEHHILPEFLHPRPGQLQALAALRVTAAAAGLLLILVVRPWAGRLVERKSLRGLAVAVGPSLLAAVLAVGAAELILDSMTWRSREQSPPMYEPRRVRDLTFGWRQLPDRTGYGVTGGRRVRYDFDVHGYRVRRLDRPVDLAAPTIVFAGESILQGHGLNYDETAPAQVAAMTGVQAANIAVGGYATDQVYLLVRHELPKFRQPVAVVTIFMPGLFHRNMDTDRPHLTRGLVWTPPRRQPRLLEIFGRVAPYRSDRDIDAGVAATQQALGGIVALARARGAVPLILVPQIGPETNEERAIRHRVLDAARLPYVTAPMPAAWLLPNNRHPDARGARVLALAVAAYLEHHQDRDLAPPTPLMPRAARAVQSTPAPAAVG
ncbi:hypothetical protein [Phenylobacterium sp.]|uniref:hypothetical protein n=1 Tax=Phenylobacterium sp. TaxID=1871053 RepID=UPI0025D9DE9F|nr:hypothetical protein [Phenylobacterium sp.]